MLPVRSPAYQTLEQAYAGSIRWRLCDATCRGRVTPSRPSGPRVRRECRRVSTMSEMSGWKDIQFTATVVPMYRVTREQAATIEVIHDMTLRVSGRRNRHHPRRYSHRSVWRGYIGSIWRSIGIGFSYPTRAPYRSAQRSASATSSRWLSNTCAIPPKASRRSANGRLNRGESTIRFPSGCIIR